MVQNMYQMHCVGCDDAGVYKAKKCTCVCKVSFEFWISSGVCINKYINVQCWMHMNFTAGNTNSKTC
jgi:hypothetical protein